jgi:hypothetical protein
LPFVQLAVDGNIRKKSKRSSFIGAKFHPMEYGRVRIAHQFALVAVGQEKRLLALGILEFGEECHGRFIFSGIGIAWLRVAAVASRSVWAASETVMSRKAASMGRL